MLVTERSARFMRSGAGDADEMAGRALWWPPTKIAGRYLSPYLAALDGVDAVDAPTPPGEPVQLDLERELPSAADALRRASLRGSSSALRAGRAAEAQPGATLRLNALGHRAWLH
jgi:sulfide:quinone oxidoreductase